MTKKLIILKINTIDRMKNEVSLIIGKQEFSMEQEETSRQNQELLPMIMELLKKHNLTLRDLTAIEVNKGPGSFVGVRVGVSIGNALSFALQIPVNGTIVQDEKTIVEPVYSA